MMDENLRNALNSGLYVVEKNLRMVTQLLDQHPMRGITYSLEEIVDSRIDAEARIAINKMLKEIELLRETYDLPVRTESIKRRIYSCLGEVWFTLHDCKPERIQGYGKLQDSDIVFLDEHIDPMLKLVTHLEQTLYPKKPK